MNKYFGIGCLTLLTLNTQAEGYGAKPPETVIPYKHRAELLEIKKPEVIPPAAPEIVNHPYRFEIGGNYTYAFIHPHEHRTFHGGLGGAQALFEYRPMRKFYGAGKLTWSEGKTHNSVGTRSLVYIDLEERLGYTFASEENNLRFSLFSGFGYKHLAHKFSPKSDSSIKFKYNHIYIPLGFTSDYSFNRWFTVGLGLTWMPQVYPTVKIVPLKGARWILSNKLANFYAEMPFTFSLTHDKRFTLQFTPTYEYWQDGHTTAKTNRGVRLGLPGNTYNFWGADLNLGYSF